MSSWSWAERAEALKIKNLSDRASREAVEKCWSDDLYARHTGVFLALTIPAAGGLGHLGGGKDASSRSP